jgi:hypothetical protein
MLTFMTTLGLLLGGPASFELAEVGGTVTGSGTQQLPSPVPITVNLYDGPMRVASVPADLFGRYKVSAPPGDYWLQLVVGNEEARVERVHLKPGSWQHDFDVQLLPPASPAFAERSTRHVVGM